MKANHCFLDYLRAAPKGSRRSFTWALLFLGERLRFYFFAGRKYSWIFMFQCYEIIFRRAGVFSCSWIDAWVGFCFWTWTFPWKLLLRLVRCWFWTWYVFWEWLTEWFWWFGLVPAVCVEGYLCQHLMFFISSDICVSSGLILFWSFIAFLFFLIVSLNILLWFLHERFDFPLIVVIKRLNWKLSLFRMNLIKFFYLRMICKNISI